MAKPRCVPLMGGPFCPSTLHQGSWGEATEAPKCVSCGGERRRPTASFRRQQFGQSAEGMGAGFRGSGSYKSFQSVAEERHDCHVHRPKGFLVHCQWKRVGEELGHVPGRGDLQGKQGTLMYDGSSGCLPLRSWKEETLLCEGETG